MRIKQTREDLIDREARSIAKERLEQSLDAQGLPLPRDSALDLHIDQLLILDPSILRLAEERVDAKADAFTTGLRLLGLVPEALDVKIDL